MRTRTGSHPDGTRTLIGAFGHVVRSSPSAVLPFLLTAAIALNATPGLAQEVEGATTAEEQSTRFGVGFQSTWPAYGLSGIIDVTPELTGQAVFGLLGPVKTFTGRALYHFSREQAYSPYGFGSIGLWRTTTVATTSLFEATERTESVLGFGAGGGIEFDWQELVSPDDDSFPPVFGNVEVGLGIVNFEHYDFSALMIGGGLHYRF